MLRGLEWATERGMTSDASIVIKHDDEYCLRLEVLHNLCCKTNLANSSLYSGYYLWSRAGYESQKALDGSFAPYFSGWLYALSSDLVLDIAPQSQIGPNGHERGIQHLGPADGMVGDESGQCGRSQVGY
jgi:hypothetical protein